MWPVVQRALDFVLALQTPRGEILWARHADGRPWPFALLTGSSSISHSLRCGLAAAHQVGEERPSWELALARLVHTIRHFGHEAFAPKDRWAMDWYYPVLAGVLQGAEARVRLASRRRIFVHEGEGVRCVSNQDWVTTAETCECVMAYLATGDRGVALSLFEWVQRLREPDGSYLTGRAFPANVSYPDRERSTYSAAAALLAADALAGTGAASGLFVDPDSLPAPLDLDPAGGARPRLAARPSPVSGVHPLGLGSRPMWHERQLRVGEDDTIAQQEVSGPVLSVIAYDGDDEAVRIANNSEFGLPGAVASADAERARTAARRIRTGHGQR